MDYSLHVEKRHDGLFDFKLNGKAFTAVDKHTMLSYIRDFFAAEFEEQEDGYDVYI